MARRDRRNRRSSSRLAARRPQGGGVGKIIGIAVGAVVVLVLIGVGLSGGGVGGSKSQRLSVSQFKKKIKWNGLMVTFKKDSEFYRRVGKPGKVQSVGDQVYLYYECKDGTLQLVLMGFPYEQGEIIITDVNRY